MARPWLQWLFTRNDSTSNKARSTKEQRRGPADMRPKIGHFDVLEDRATPATITGNTAAGGFEALSSTSLRYWLDANNLGSITKDGSNNVSAWNNSANLVNNFAQADALKQPLYVASGLLGNNLPNIQFDGNTTGQGGNPTVAPNADELLLTNSTAAASVIIVNRTTSGNGLDGIWGQELGDFGIRRASTGAWQHPGDGNDFSNPGGLFVNGNTGGAVNQNVAHILSAVRPTAQTVATTSIGDYFQVGANPARSWGGQIGDALVFDRALTTSERVVIENALGAKYGIGLAANDFYAGDDAGPGNYDSAVFGVVNVLTNVAQGKVATQSSTSSGGTPNRAVDGNTNGNWGGGSVTHTNTETNPFWIVDLASSNSISFINLFNRTDCCGDRLSDVKVEILDASNVVQWTTPSNLNPGPSPGSPATIGVDVKALNGGNPVTGNKVRVSLVGSSKILSLAEVQVLAAAGVTSAGQAGFGIEATSSFDEGDGVFAGHKTATNSLSFNDVPIGVDYRWNRVWNVDATGSVDATLAFDFSDAGLAPPGAGVLSYQLLYSANNAFESSQAPFQALNLTPTVAGDTVTFAVPGGTLVDGYYTLGVVENAALTGRTIPGGFIPVSNPNVLYWLRPDDLASITKDGSNFVSAWNDQDTIAPNNFTQGSAAKQPLYQATGFGGNNMPNIQFDGNTTGQTGNPIVAPNADELLLSTSTKPATVFLVNSTSSNNSTIDGIWGAELSDNGVRRNGATAWRNDSYPTSGSLLINNGTSLNAPLNTPVILNATNNSGATFPVTSIGDYFQVGLNAARSWGGRVGDALVLDRALNSSERDIIGNALSAKYDIALANGNLYNGDNPALGNYDWSVIGVGGAVMQNAALGKPATQSSLGHSSGDPENAVDGSTNGSFPSLSVTHTATETNPWWQVDLGTNHAVNQITLFNRTDCCGERLSDVQVQILDSSNNVLWTTPSNLNPGNILGSPASINVDVFGLNGNAPVNGSKVKVTLIGASKVLSLAEVQVIAPLQQTNIALGKPAIQSSDSSGGVASRAVDGNTNGNWGGNSVTHTATQANPFWRVDLGAMSPINQVILYNRTDCCGDRLSDVQVQILDASLNPVFTMPASAPFVNTGNGLENPLILGFDILSANGGNPINGRYVRVNLIGASKTLSLAEVQVMSPSPLVSAVSTAGSDGFALQQTSAAGTNYALAGYKTVNNAIVTTDLPGGVSGRWDRVWYADVTGSVGANMSFDFSDAGLSAPGAGVLGYRLLYSPNNNFESSASPFTILNLAPTVAGDTVTFSVPSSLLIDGYFTLGQVTGTLTATLDGSNNLVITDVSASGLNNNLTVSNDGTNIVITDLNETFQPTLIPGAVYSNGDKTLTVPVSSIPGTQVIVNTLGGSDNVTVGLANPMNRVVAFNGGNPTASVGDKLLVTGAFASGTINITNATDGVVLFGPNTINFAGVEEPVDTTGAAVSNLTINLPSTDNTGTLSDLGSSTSRLQTTNASFAGVDFANPASGGSLLVNLGAGNDTLNVNSLASGFGGSVAIDGQTNNDQVNLNGPLSLDSTLTVTSENILVTSPITTTGDAVTFNGNVTVGAAAPYPSAVLATPNLDVYWRLGEASGTTAFDSAPPPQNGTYNGGPTLGVVGALVGDANTAVGLDGVSDSISGSVPLNPSITIEVWARSTTPNWNDNGWIAASRGVNGFIIHPSAGSKAWQGYILNSSAAYTFVGSHTPADIQSWNHYALTYDAGTNTGRLFFNGALVGSTVVAIPRTSTVGNVFVGKDDGAGRFGQGAEDEFALYSRALSPAEILAHYNAGITPNGTAFTTAGGNVTVNGTVDGSSLLQVNAGAGDVSFTGAVGGTTPLPGLTIVNAHDVNFGSTLAVNGNVLQSAGTGTTTIRGTSGAGVTGSLTITNNAIDLLAATTTVAGNVSLTAQTDVNVNAALLVTGTASAATISAQNAVNANANVTAMTGSINVNANQDGAGAQGFTQANGTAISAGTGVSIRVNTNGGAGSGGAVVSNINSAGATSINTSNTAGTAGGSITRTAASTITAAGGLTLTTGIGSIGTGTGANALNLGVNQIVSFSTHAATGDVWLANGSIIVLNSSTTTGGDVHIATPNLVLNNATVTTGGGAFTAQGDVVLLDYPTLVQNTPNASVYWRLGEATGPTAFDSVPPQLNGVYGGTPTLGVPGALAGSNDTALTLNGDDDVSASLPMTPSFTVEVWARSATPNWNDYGWLASARSPNGFILHTTPGGHGWDGYVVNSVGAYTYIASHNPADIMGWHHYALSYDAATSTGRIFFDGAQVGANSVPVARTSTNATVHVGKDDGAGRFGLGSEDEFALYSRALSGPEIAARFALGAFGAADSIATGGGAVTVTGAINGGAHFTLNASGGAVDLQGAVGNFTPLSSLSVTSSTLNTQAITTIEGGAVAVNNSAAWNPSGNVNSGGVFNQSGSGAVNLDVNVATTNDNVTFSGPVTVSGPAQVSTGSGNIVYTGSLAVGGNTLTLSENGLAELGTLTTISGGTIAATNGVEVGSGDSLQAAGTINGPLNVLAGGSVSNAGTPGTGTLNTGNFSLSTGSSYVVDLASLASFDKTNVTGTVALNNATLTLNVNYAPAGTDSFLLIDNDGSVDPTGQFNGLPGNSIIGGFKIFYTGGDGNDVVLLPVIPGLVYADDNWASLPANTFILDADPETAGNQFAIIGYNGFGSIGGALGGVALSGQVLINDGVYPEAVNAASAVSMKLLGTGPNPPGFPGSVTVNSLAGVAAASLDLGVDTLTVGDGTPSTTFHGPVSGSAGLTKVGSGTLVLNGTNTYAGMTTISSGTLQIGNGGLTGTVAPANILNNANLVFDRAGALAVNNTISGTGTLTKNGSGTVTLGGTVANSYGGLTTVNAGVLALAKTAGLDAVSALIQVGDGVGDGTLLVQNSDQVPDGATITVDSDGVFRVDTGATETLNAFPTLSDPTSDVQVGGTLTINSSITQTTGLTTLDGGLLRVGATGTAVLNLNGGTLQGDGTVQAQMVNNAARIDPGVNGSPSPAVSAGTITIQGNLNTTGTIHIDLQDPSVFDKIAVVQNTNIGPISGGYIGATPTAINGTVKFGGAIETGAINGFTAPVSTPPSPSTYVGVMTFEYRLLGDTFNGVDPNRSRLPSDFATKTGLAFGGGPLDSRFQTSTNQNNARSQYSSPTGLLTNPKNLVSQLAKKLTLTALGSVTTSHTAKATPTGADTYVKTLAPTAINYGGSMHNFVMVQSIKNNTAATIVGPIYLEVEIPVASTAKLFNSAGTTGAGKPYVVIQNASIAPGATALVNVELDFLCPTSSLPVQAGQALLNYRILAGGLP